MWSCRVLIADDEERIRNGLKRLLEEIIGGFEVVAMASDGKAAYKLAVEKSIDLIISDIRMPNMNGLEFIQSIKQVLPDVSIIILSAHNDYEYMRKAIHFGVSDYLRKPIDRIEFTNILSQYRKKHERLQTANEETRLLIRRIQKIIEERLHEHISLQDIAHEVQYSYNHLSYLFKKETGLNFSDYLTKMRIEKSKVLLRDTELKVFEISQLCGYCNSKYFTKAFKEHTSYTPRQYRDTQLV